MIRAPQYTLLEATDKDEFLNYRGSFTPDERALFHQLCSVWEPLIPYNRFVRRASGQRGEARHALDSLLKKLFRARIAVVVSAVGDDGELIPHSIALTEENSQRFFALAVDEYFQQVRRALDNPLPFYRTLVDDGLTIPEAFVSDLPAEQIARILGEPSSDEQQIYRISVASGRKIVVTAKRIRSFLGLAMQKLRHLLSNPNILAALAREMNSNLTTLQKNIDGKEPRFWYTLSETILSARPRLQAQRAVPTTEELFAASEILHAFVEGQIQEFKRQKEAERKRKENIDALLASFEARDQPVIAEDELYGVIDSFASEHTEDFAEFKQEFEERALAPQGSRKLAILNRFDNEYIHRLRVYPVFLEGLETMHRELYAHYRKLMRQHIRGGRRNRNQAFYNNENFADDIANQLETRMPLFSRMYQAPEIVSESVVHWATEKGHARDLEQMKKLLQRHFVPGTTEFLELPVLLDLRLNEIYDSAFRDLSPLRQILYRICGRYKAMREGFMAESRKYASSENAMRLAQPPSDSEAGSRRSHRGASAQGRSRTRESLSSLPKGSQKKRPATLQDVPESQQDTAEKRRPYTKEESEQAWNEFKKHLDK